MKRLLFLVCVVIPLFASSINNSIPRKRIMFGEDQFHPQGTIQVGMRTTLSAFNHDAAAGYGVGGQFRIWLWEKVNTDWFADYINTDLDGLGRRVDGHIGWSVLFYPFKGTLQSKFTPYFLAGHCFDYTKITPYNSLTELNTIEAKKRWSAAVQAGLGCHWNITPKFNISLTTQYMVHLGNDIHLEVIDINGVKQLNVTDEGGSSLEGHLLTNLSLNVRLGDLW